MAQGDITKFDKVTTLNVHKCLMYLEYLKEKSDVEDKLMKKRMKR